MTMKALLPLLLLAAPALAADDPPDLYIAPYLQNVTPDSITVMWETTEPFLGVVEYGANESFDRKASESVARKIHEVRIEGLHPGRTYDYRVRYGKRVLAPASFTAAPEPGTGNWRMVVYGDNRSNPATHARNVEQIRKLDPDIILNSGDLVADGSEYSLWKEQYFDPLRGVSEYIPIFPCLGNHERNAEHYYRYHSLPDENGEVYYSFDYGNAHIVALNSNAKDAPFELGAAQTEWLIRDLEKHKDAEWKFVFFHHPLFRSHKTRGVTEQRWVWQPLFEKLGVDMVINGHDHYYMRSYPIGKYTGKPKRGLYHLISGGGGAPTYPITPKEHAAYRRSIHHVTVIDVMGDRLIGRAVDIDGDVFDAFVVDKQIENSPEEFIAYEIYELKRDLSRAIRERPAAAASGGEIHIEHTIEIPNPFEVPLRAVFSWRGTNGWRVSPQRKSFTLRPGEPIRLPIRARGRSEELYPLPTAELEFRALDGEKAFRNDKVEFFPLKIWRDLTLDVPAAGTAPKIDGSLDDAAWKSALLLSEFVSAQGDRAPERKVEARLAQRGGSLYIAARIEAPATLETRYTGRDNPRALRDDHFRVQLAASRQVFTFAVSAGGAAVDMKGADEEWNSGFRTAVSKVEGGWQAEMEIPLEGLGLIDQPLRINLVRRDSTNLSEAELTPTFGDSGLELRVPTYQTDPSAVERFAKLNFSPPAR